MKHFYSFSLAFIAMFSAQLLFAQQTNLTAGKMDQVASRVDFNQVINLSQNTGFFTENNVGKTSATKEEKDISTTAQYNATDFRIVPDNAANDCKASFVAPKSGKAQLKVKSISGQLIYNENIEIIKGNNSQLIQAADLKSGMYLVSVINEQVNYKGKLQKMQ